VDYDNGFVKSPEFVPIQWVPLAACSVFACESGADAHQFCLPEGEGYMSIRSKLLATVAVPVLSASILAQPVLADTLTAPLLLAQENGNQPSDEQLLQQQREADEQQKAADEEARRAEEQQRAAEQENRRQEEEQQQKEHNVD